MPAIEIANHQPPTELNQRIRPKSAAAYHVPGATEYRASQAKVKKIFPGRACQGLRLARLRHSAALGDKPMSLAFVVAAPFLSASLRPLPLRAFARHLSRRSLTLPLLAHFPQPPIQSANQFPVERLAPHPAHRDIALAPTAQSRLHFSLRVLRITLRNPRHQVHRLATLRRPCHHQRSLPEKERFHQCDRHRDRRPTAKIEQHLAFPIRHARHPQLPHDHRRQQDAAP